MRIDTRALGWAAAAVAAASFVICALLVALAPATTMAAFSFVMHVDLSTMTRSLTWASFFGGALIFSATVGVHVWLFGRLYNLIADTRPAAVTAAGRNPDVVTGAVRG